jgi:hypothetical protein
MAHNRARGRETAMTVDTDNLIALNDVAATLGVCRATVYNFLVRGTLRGVKVGGLTKVRSPTACAMSCILRVRSMMIIAPLAGL